jgi:DNA-directed RNA polymerase subunit RPC12/RpoP
MKEQYNKFTINDAIEIIKLSRYEYVEGEYTGNGKRTLIVKDDDDYYYHCSLVNIQETIKTGGSLFRFGYNNYFSTINIKNWLIKNNKTFELFSGEFTASKDKNLIFRCFECGHTFPSKWNNIQIGKGCPYCSGRLPTETYNLLTEFPDISKEWNYSKNDKRPEDYCPKVARKVNWICSKCSYQWPATINSRTNMGTGCPRCQSNSSRGERKIQKILLSFGIDEKDICLQWSFNNCKYVYYLYYDFYLPNYNMLIEYQGIQHYEPVDFGGKGIEWAKEQLVQNKQKDKIKFDYCQNNNIPLLIIPYWDFDNIENILYECLNI